MRTHTIWRTSLPFHPDEEMLRQRALELRKRHYATIIKKAMKQGCSRGEAQQVAEKCLAALAKREARPNAPAIDNEVAWLNGTVSNAVKKHLRKRARQYDSDLLNYAIRCDVDLTKASRIQATLNAIRTLPNRLKWPLSLAARDASLAEIAAELNYSEKVTARRLKSAREELHRRLNN